MDDKVRTLREDGDVIAVIAPVDLAVAEFDAVIGKAEEEVGSESLDIQETDDEVIFAVPGIQTPLGELAEN